MLLGASAVAGLALPVDGEGSVASAAARRDLPTPARTEASSELSPDRLSFHLGAAVRSVQRKIEERGLERGRAEPVAIAHEPAELGAQVRRGARVQ